MGLRVPLGPFAAEGSRVLSHHACRSRELDPWADRHQKAELTAAFPITHPV